MAEATGVVPVIAPPEGPPPASRRGRYGLLLATTVLSLAVQGAVAPSDVQGVVVTALAAASLVLAFHAARLSPRWVAIAAGIAATMLLASIARALFGGIGEGAARTMNAALVALGPPAVAIGVVRDLRTSGQVRMEAVMGVLALYMLIGMFFGFVYGAVDRLGTETFFADGQPATVSRCLYFSFVTLATVGYGDLVAATDVGRTLSIFEALIGQIYLVTVVSLIVSNLGRTPLRMRSDGERR